MFFQSLFIQFVKICVLFLCFSCKNLSGKKDDILVESEKEYCEIMDSCTIDNNVSLYLYSNNDKAVIKIIQNNDLYLIDTLQLTAPRFLREHNEIQSHSFKNIKVNHVIFIVGDKKASTQKYSVIQGIVLKEDSIIISKRKIDIDVDDDQWIDGKFFLDVAYYP